jgi:hypothetical protein
MLLLTSSFAFREFDPVLYSAIFSEKSISVSA